MPGTPGRRGAGSRPDAAEQVAPARLAGFQVRMKAAPGMCRGRGRSRGGSPPARCQMDPAESYTLPARKLSSPVIWEPWRQRGRGGSLRPGPPSWLHSGLRREPPCGRGRPAGSGSQVLPPRRGLGFLTPAVSVAFDFPSGVGTCHPAPTAHPRRLVVSVWRVYTCELEGQPLACSLGAAAGGAGVRLGSVRD